MVDDDTVPGAVRRNRLVVAGAVVLLLVVAALQVLPAPSRLETHVAPNAGDPVLLTWILEHQARALLGDPSTLYEGNIFFPEPSAIAWSDNVTALVPAYLAVWLASGRSSVLAYNVVTWLAFAAGTLAVLALARRLLRSPVAATIVAVAFSVAVVRQSAIGHVQLAGFAFFPLALLLLMDVVERRKATTAVLAGACLAGLWYTAIYFFVLAVMAVPVFAVVWALADPRRVTRRLLGLAATAAVVTAVLVAPSLPAYLDVQARATFERNDAELLTIGPRSFTQPPSLLYEALDEDDVPNEGTDGFVGLSVLALAVVALAASAVHARHGWGTATAAAPAGTVAPGGAGPDRDAASGAARGAVSATTPARWTPSQRRKRFAVPLAAACVVGALVSLGPDDGFLSLPYDVARAVVPGLESTRALNRFWVLPALGFALLAGRGFERLTEGRRFPVRLGAGLVVIALVLAELFVRPGFSEVALATEHLAINRELATLEPGPVTELPFPTVPDLPYVLAVRQLRSLEDGLPRVEGYSGDWPAGLAEYLQTVSTFPSAPALAALRQAGVRHVVLHGADEPCVGRYGPEELADILATARGLPAVEDVTTVGAGAIVTLTPEPRRGPLTAIAPVAAATRTTTSCTDN